MDVKNLIGGLLAGAVIGVAIGFLLAPQSGAKSREDIAKASRKLADSLNGAMEDSIDSIKERFTVDVDDLTENGREVFTSGNNKVKT